MTRIKCRINGTVQSVQISDLQNDYPKWATAAIKLFLPNCQKFICPRLVAPRNTAWISCKSHDFFASSSTATWSSGVATEEKRMHLQETPLAELESTQVPWMFSHDHAWNPVCSYLDWVQYSAIKCNRTSLELCVAITNPEDLSFPHCSSNFMWYI